MDGSSRSTQSGGPGTQSGLACNICLRRMPNSPVATYCGHLFCWPCLYRSWPQQDPGAQAGPAITKPCPACRTALREGFNIVPIYGYDNVASPRSGTERLTTTGTTTTAAATAPDTAIPPRRAASASVPEGAIPPRPTPSASASVPVTATAVSNTPIPSLPTAVAVAAAASAHTAIPPRPNPPARITQTQTQTDAARAPPARPLGPNRIGSLRNLAPTIPRHGNLGELFGFGTGDRLRPSSSAARTIGLGVPSRSIRRRRNLRLNPRGMDGIGGIRFDQAPRARMDRVLYILDDIVASLAQINALRDARDRLDDDLI